MTRDAMQKPATGHWTYEDYLRLPDDGTRCEIIEGERLMTPAPASRHQWASIHLASALLTFVERNGLGVVYEAPYDVVLAQDTVVQPDIVVVLKTHDARLKESGLFGAPDLAIEILSPSTEDRDRSRKMRAYARHGVQEFWIVDPEEKRIEIHLLEQGRMVRKTDCRAGAASSLVVVPGFAIELDSVFMP
jgi:Uma2 family endonuclease